MTDTSKPLMNLFENIKIASLGNSDICNMIDDFIASEAIKKWEDSQVGKTYYGGQISEDEIIGDKIIPDRQDSSGKETEYWKQRCLAAEYLISPDACYVLKVHYQKWRTLRQSVPPYKEEVDKEDELWNEVMQEMGFYSSQLDNIKSKFHLSRKI